MLSRQQHRTMSSPLSSPKGRAPVTTRAAVTYPAGAQESLREFPNSSGLGKLSGLFVQTQNSDDVVLLCHGYASSKNGFRLPEIARELAYKNLCSLRFDFSGNGASDGAFDFAGYEREVGDLRAAVLYVRGTLHKKVSAILGHSKGGNIVLMYSSAFDDVPLVVNVAARFDMKRGIEERFGAETIAKAMKLGQVEVTTQTDTTRGVKFLLTKGALNERLSVNMEEVCKKITISEVLTIHGSEDTTIPVEDANSISRCIRNHTLHIVPGANHNFSDKANGEACIKKAVDFILAGL